MTPLALIVSLIISFTLPDLVNRMGDHVPGYIYEPVFPLGTSAAVFTVFFIVLPTDMKVHFKNCFRKRLD